MFSHLAHARFGLLNEYLQRAGEVPSPDAALEELPTYSLQDLFAFYQGADGAFSEGAMAEMMARFSQDPVSFLSALAGAEQDLQALITNNLGVSIFFSGEYQTSLFDAQNLDLNEQQSTLLEYIIAAYESSAF